MGTPTFTVEYAVSAGGVLAAAGRAPRVTLRAGWAQAGAAQHAVAVQRTDKPSSSTLIRLALMFPMSPMLQPHQPVKAAAPLKANNPPMVDN